jgi:citrate synthase
MGDQRSTRTPTDRRQQPRGTRDVWKTATTCIEPNRILIRGFPVDEMMGRVSFAEAVYLLLVGELPTPAIGKMISAILVSSCDHGATPPSAIRWRPVFSPSAPTTAGTSKTACACSIRDWGS